MAAITKEYAFEACHMLPGHKGKCSRYHGHSYRVEVCIEGFIQSDLEPATSQGFVLDFGDLDDIVEPLIESKCDHFFLNDTLFIPRTTAEYIACWFLYQIREALSHEPRKCFVSWVRVWETAKSSSLVTWEDVHNDSILCSMWGIREEAPGLP